jgi:TetR/AcrR family transcriptional regulator, repressor for uid operon
MSAVEGVVGDEVVDHTRVRLLEAAAAVFAEKGYDGAGVQEIARRAGLTTGAIYGRFTGKAELLREVIAQCSSDELDELFNQHRFEGHASDIVLVAGSHLVDRRDAEVQRGDALLLEAFVASRRDPEIRDAVRALMDERADRLGAVLETAKADGSLDPTLDTASLVAFCHAVGLGFLIYDALGVDLPDSQPWEQLITRLVAAVATPNDQLPPPEGA